MRSRISLLQEDFMTADVVAALKNLGRRCLEPPTPTPPCNGTPMVVAMYLLQEALFRLQPSIQRSFRSSPTQYLCHAPIHTQLLSTLPRSSLPAAVPPYPCPSRPPTVLRPCFHNPNQSPVQKVGCPVTADEGPGGRKEQVDAGGVPGCDSALAHRAAPRPGPAPRLVAKRWCTGGGGGRGGAAATAAQRRLPGRLLGVSRGRRPAGRRRAARPANRGVVRGDVPGRALGWGSKATRGRGPWGLALGLPQGGWRVLSRTGASRTAGAR